MYLRVCFPHNSSFSTHLSLGLSVRESQLFASRLSERLLLPAWIAKLLSVIVGRLQSKNKRKRIGINYSTLCIFEEQSSREGFLFAFFHQGSLTSPKTPWWSIMFKIHARLLKALHSKGMLILIIYIFFFPLAPFSHLHLKFCAAQETGRLAVCLMQQIPQTRAITS